MQFDGRRVLYQWIGGTRKDWRGQGHFRALTEEQEVWALDNGFDEIIVKTKNRFYEMRSTLAQLAFDVIRFVPHPVDSGESKVFLSKRLGQHVIDSHRSRRSVHANRRLIDQASIATTIRGSSRTLTSASRRGSRRTACSSPKDASSSNGC